MSILKPFVTALLALLSAAAFAAVDVNHASQAELESVKGIGPSMSTRMLEARKAAPFADWADLRSRVKGVGEASAAKFSADGLTVNGKPYALTAATAAPTDAAKATKKPAAASKP